MLEGDTRHGGTRWRRRAAAAPAIFAVLALWPATAAAATISPTTFTDESVDNTTCSLREAITSANSNSNALENACTQGQSGATDEIALAAGTYTLAGSAGDDLNAGGDLDITAGGGQLFLNGASDSNGVPKTTINANNVDRILDLQSDAGSVDVLARDLILRNGNVPSTSTGNGGAIRVGDTDASFELRASRVLDSDAGHYGGGVYFENGTAAATFRIVQSELAGNTAGSEGGGFWLDIDYGAFTQLENSTVAGNSADMGGGIYLGTRANDGVGLDVNNSTLSGNTASVAGGGLAFDLGEAGNAYFRFSTIADNTSAAANSGGGFYMSDGTGVTGQYMNFEGTIIANNTAAGASSNCAGDLHIDSLGNNLESANSCQLDDGTDLHNANPQLAPLATYPATSSALVPFGVEPSSAVQTTRTRALYQGSPALDRILRASLGDCPTYDQRYLKRPAPPTGRCDIGAFEGSIPRPGAVKCGGRTATRVGTNGKDKLVGTKKADVIAGLGGGDKIKGKGGKDIICGGAGNDRLIGGGGKDKLLGGKGRDLLRGGPGRDKLKGGPGRDRQIQ